MKPHPLFMGLIKAAKERGLGATPKAGKS